MNDVTKTKRDCSWISSGYDKAICLYTTNMQTQKYFFSQKKEKNSEKSANGKFKDNASTAITSMK